jgi:riboflavin kinase / FMN adenylyltransferase
MKIHAGSIEELSLDKACIAIGSFDGVHIGHKKLINRLIQSARATNSQVVVLSFFPHPAVVLKNIISPYYLSTPEEKADLLEALGVDLLITIPFTKELAALPAEEFMQLLKKHIGVQELVVGKGFALGKGRLGTVEVLSKIGEKLGFTVLEIDPENYGEIVISSSKIRQIIEEGDVQSASVFLGRQYSIQGVVINGDGRGRTIGIPTANLDVWPEKLLPSPGVYRCFSIVDGISHLSVANIGYRPTFSNDLKRLSVEAHILDFDRNLYGKEIQLQFSHRMRGEIKFPSFEELIQQIHKDILTARELK